MERIHYAGGSFLTGSTISEALFAYAAALAKQESSVSLEVPIRADDGSAGIARVLVGPASQFVSVPEASSFDELTDDGFVANVRHETALLGPQRAGSLDEIDMLSEGVADL